MSHMTVDLEVVKSAVLLACRDMARISPAWNSVATASCLIRGGPKSLEDWRFPRDTAVITFTRRYLCVRACAGASG